MSRALTALPPERPAVSAAPEGPCAPPRGPSSLPFAPPVRMLKSCSQPRRERTHKSSKRCKIRHIYERFLAKVICVLPGQPCLSRVPRGPSATTQVLTICLSARPVPPEGTATQWGPQSRKVRGHIVISESRLVSSPVSHDIKELRVLFFFFFPRYLPARVFLQRRSYGPCAADLRQLPE